MCKAVSNLIKSLQQYLKKGVIITLLQKRKLSLCEVKCLSQNHSLQEVMGLDSVSATICPLDLSCVLRVENYPHSYQILLRVTFFQHLHVKGMLLPSQNCE